ncbi:MAG: hypothetical protein E7605_02445 [Ruminococcaceae bacterium]|nr:hypothetical protein [Oscillospiraceae bacterium]
MKKFLSLLLALLMVVSVCVGLVACNPSEEDPGKTETPNKPNENEKDPNEPNKPQEPVRIELKFPEEYNFSDNGTAASFHILQWSVDQEDQAGTAWIPWEEGDVSMDDGDLISKQILERNSVAEYKYGVEITAEYKGVNAGYVDRVKSDHMTSANEIQLLTIRSLGAWELVDSEYLTDMNVYSDQNILHTEQPWWVQDAVASYTLGESLYVCATEMLLRDKGATTAMYFNPSIAEDHGLDDFYAMVEDGTWTWEAMLEAAETVGSSTDGNDLMDSVEDMWGVQGSDDDTHMLYNALGFLYAHIDEDGFVVYDLGETDESITILIDIHEDFHYADWNTNRIDNKLVGGEDVEDIFTIDRALFKTASCVKTAVTKLRNMNTDYGILPMPKLTEEQENYSSLVWVHHDCVLGIPAATANPEMSAVILEVLSYEGYYEVTPVLYDTILYGRAAKTAEAKRSLEIIFETRSYDPGQYWDDPAGLQDKLLRLCNEGTSDIQSLIAQYIGQTEEEIKKVNEFVEKKYDEE